MGDEAFGSAGIEALDNTLAIAERCNVELPIGANHAPVVVVKAPPARSPHAAALSLSIPSSSPKDGRALASRLVVTVTSSPAVRDETDERRHRRKARRGLPLLL